MGSDLHLPQGTPTGIAAVVVHPHPEMGGDRHHPLVVAVARGLADRGVAALRPDLTDPDVADATTALQTAVTELLAETGARRLVLVGYSWGAAVALGATPDQLVARVLVAPPVTFLDVGVPDGTPTLVLVPEHDQYGGPVAVELLMGDWPATTIEVVDGADHFVMGAISMIATRAVDWITAI